MGLDVSGSLVVGVRVTKADFIQITEEFIGCSNRHPRPDQTSKYCPEDGTPFRTIQVDTPKMETTAFLKELELESIEELFTDTYEHEGRIIVFNVATFQSYEMRGHEIVWALGAMIHQTRSHRLGNKGEPKGINIQEIVKQGSLVLSKAMALGITGRKVELFLSLNFSY